MNIYTEKLPSLTSLAGVDIKNSNTFDSVMTKSGFDFDVEKVPCYTPEAEELNSHFLIRRQDNHHVLGVMKSRYIPVSNRFMFKPFHDTVVNAGANYESAGMIDHGKKCWISASLPKTFKLKNRPDDEIKQTIVALVNHDGTGRNSYFSLAERLFCNNQLRLISTSAAKSQYTVSHTKNWESQWFDAQIGFDNAVLGWKSFEVQANKLDNINITVNEMHRFTTNLFPQKRLDDKNKLKKPSSRLLAKREQILDLFTNGSGNIGKTRWDAFNAVTEYVDHNNTETNKSKSVTDHKRQKRFSRNLLGSGDYTKQRALDMLLTQKKFSIVL